MSGIVVRSAGPADAGALAALLAAIASARGGAGDDAAARGTLTAMMAEAGDTVLWHVAEDQDSGDFLGLQTVTKTPWRGHNAGRLETFTRPHRDEIATGSALFAHSRTVARRQRLRGLLAEVSPSNQAATIYYQSRGFERVESPPNPTEPDIIAFWYRLP